RASARLRTPPARRRAAAQARRRRRGRRTRSGAGPAGVRRRDGRGSDRWAASLHPAPTRLESAGLEGRMRLACVSLALVLSASLAAQSPAPPSSKSLGTIHFSSSAKPAAQESFLTGVKALFNFEFDIAAEAFQQAQKADPAFALGYWGEAMSFNHPLWAQQDQAAARKGMDRLAPAAAARAAKAPAGKERMLVESLEVLYGTGDKLTRDIAYAAELKKIHEKYPDDDEVATFYALALLGTARPG